MEICLEKNKDSHHRCDEGHVTLQEALDSAGYTGSHGCPTLCRKLAKAREFEAVTDDDLAVSALVGLSQEVTQIDETNVAELIASEEPVLASQSTGRKGNSGRPALTDVEKSRRQLERNSVNGYKTFAAYAREVLEAVSIIRAVEVGQKSARARDLITERFTKLGTPALTFKHLVELASDENFDELKRRGGPLFTTSEEETIAARIRASRSHYCAIYPRQVICWANGLLQQDSERWDATGGEGCTRGWFRGFAKRNGFKMHTKKDMDILRLKWTTSKNAHKFYDVLYRGAIKLGVATAVCDRPLSEPGGTQLEFTYPGLFASLDETNITLSQQAMHGTSAQVVCDVHDNAGNCLYSKGLPSSSLLYGRNGYGQMLPPLVVVGGRKKLPDSFPKPNLLGACISEGGGEHALPSSCCDANGQLIPTMWRASDTSAVSSDILKEWAEKYLIPSFKAHGLSAEKPAILLVDGVQTHCGFELAVHLRQHHVYAFLRPPNTSARLQGEDTTVFPYVFVCLTL